MSAISSSTDTVVSTATSTGLVDGINLLRADTSSAAGNPSSKSDRVSLSDQSSSSSSETYGNTAATNRASAKSANATRSQEAKMMQSQDSQAISNINRMQRAYASVAQSTGAGASVKNSFNDLFASQKAGIVQSTTRSNSPSILSQQVVQTTPATTVALNPTASSMLLSQQAQAAGATRAGADYNDVDTGRSSSTVEEIKEA